MRQTGKTHRKRKPHCALTPEPLEPRRLLSTYTVNTLSDSSNPGPGLLSLRQAVADVNAHPGPNTIDFDPKAFPADGENTLVLGQGSLTITQASGAITIIGPGENSLAISGNGQSQVFAVAAGAVVAIEDLTISDGNASVPSTIGDGGGIYDQGTLTVSDCAVENCRAVSGGGIYSTGTLALTDTTFEVNSAESGGGGAYAADGVQATDSTFAENSAWTGGAIGASGTSTLHDATIKDNTAAFAGGGIFADNLTVEESTISGNAAAATQYLASGGGVYADGTLLLTDSVVIGNSATSGVGADAWGGGIRAESSATISGCSVVDNSAVAGGGEGSGYGFAAEGGGVWAGAALRVVDSTLSGNSARGGNGGAGVYYDAGNGGYAHGGAINGESSVTLVDSTVANNSTVGGNGGKSATGGPNNIDVGGNGGNAGAAITAPESLELYDSTVTGNTATGGTGGASWNLPTAGAGSAYGGVSGFKPMLLDNSIVSGNTADGTFSDIVGAVFSASANNVIGSGSYLGNGVNGNIVGVNNPMLSPLGNYGGPTQTIIPLPGSPAIAAGSVSLIPAGVTTDQRGLPRLFNSKVDIGAVELSSITITGSVYNDGNGNGSRQANESGLAGWQVYVDVNDIGYYVSGDPVAKTNSAGNYTLTYSPIETSTPLIIREVRQNDWTRTQPAGIFPLGFYSINVPTTSETITNINFGNDLPITISGNVYNDLNGNGSQQSNEPGLTGWQVYVDETDVGYYVTGDPVATTNSAGNYTLVANAPAPGTTPLIIREVRLNNWRRTQPAGLYPLGYYTLSPSTTSFANINFGDSTTSLITGTAFVDANHNGKQDPGEEALSGWVIELDALINGVWQVDKQSTTTNANGVFSFIVAAGTYRIHEVPKTGVKVTTPPAGSYTLTTTAGSTLSGENFGNA